MAKNLIPEYQFIIKGGYSCEKVDIFSDYVNTLYKVKAESKGAKRWIAKLLLNCLYGGFGRSNNTTSCIVVNAKEFKKRRFLFILIYSIPRSTHSLRSLTKSSNYIFFNCINSN